MLISVSFVSPPKCHPNYMRMDDNPYLKVTKAAQQFRAPYNRLMARRYGGPPR